MKTYRKGFFYTVPQVVVEAVGLESGPLRDIYSIILNISQDGDTACTCTMKYFQDWTLQSESTVRRCLRELEGCGLISIVRISEGRGALTEYRANLEKLDQIQKGIILTPIKKGINLTEKGVKLTKKGCQIDRQDNNNIIINNNLFFRVTRTREEEEKELYKFFFFNNAADPAAETKAFYRTNDIAGWTANGKPLDTFEKKLAWASGWEMKTGKNRINKYFLTALRKIYNDALRRGDAYAEKLLNPRLRVDSNETAVMLHCPADFIDWVQTQTQNVSSAAYQALKTFLAGRKLCYQPETLSYETTE